MSKRLDILLAGMQLAEEKGLNNVTRQDIAEYLGIAPSLVSHYFGEMQTMREAIARQAAKANNLNVILQAMVLGYPVKEFTTREQRALAILSSLEEK